MMNTYQRLKLGLTLLRSGHVFTSFFIMTHYLTRAETPLLIPDSRLMTHYLLNVPYDIITDVTMTHADSCLLTTYVIMTHSQDPRTRIASYVCSTQTSFIRI